MDAPLLLLWLDARAICLLGEKWPPGHLRMKTQAWAGGKARSCRPHTLATKERAVKNVLPFERFIWFPFFERFPHLRFQSAPSHRLPTCLLLPCTPAVPRGEGRPMRSPHPQSWSCGLTPSRQGPGAKEPAGLCRFPRPGPQFPHL